MAKNGTFSLILEIHACTGSWYMVQYIALCSLRSSGGGCGGGDIVGSFGHWSGLFTRHGQPSSTLTFVNSGSEKHIPEDPWNWCWYIYLREWLIFMVNVAKYTFSMDPMGSRWWFHVVSIFALCIFIPTWGKNQI